MVLLFVVIILYVFFCFLISYCFDEATLVIDKLDNLSLRMPKVTDFTDSPDELHLSCYTQEVICPAYYYFMLLRDLEVAGDKDSTSLLIKLQMAIFFGYALNNVGVSELFCVPISLAACVALSLAVTAIYKHTRLSIDTFDDSIEEMKNRFDDNINRYKKFGISYEAALNNYLIASHMGYLLPIENTMRRRKIGREVLIATGPLIHIPLFLLCLVAYI